MPVLRYLGRRLDRELVNDGDVLRRKIAESIEVALNCNILDVGAVNPSVPQTLDLVVRRPCPQVITPDIVLTALLHGSVPSVGFLTVARVLFKHRETSEARLDAGSAVLNLSWILTLDACDPPTA